MGTNGRRFLVVTKVVKLPDSSLEKSGMMIPTDNIEVINGFKNGAVVINYKLKGELHNVNVEESFIDIMNSKHTIEL